MKQFGIYKVFAVCENLIKLQSGVDYIFIDMDKIISYSKMCSCKGDEKHPILYHVYVLYVGCYDYIEYLFMDAIEANRFYTAINDYSSPVVALPDFPIGRKSYPKRNNVF